MSATYVKKKLMKNKVELTIFMDIFKVEIPNGLREDKINKLVHKQIMKAIAQDKVSYSWIGK